MTKAHTIHVLDIVPGSLKAVLNEQPGPNMVHSLTVTVDVEVEVDWKVELCPAPSPGINPLVKLLVFDVEVPSGPHSNAIARRTVTYREKPAKEHYSDVTIENGERPAHAKVSIIV